MRVLVLGADGMFGHQMVPTLLGAGHEVVAATRRAPDPATAAALSGARLLAGVDARVAETVVGALGDARPDAVVNAIGIVKQRPEARHAVESIRVNSLFPHELHLLCTAVGARLVHLSTDCVFSGRTGNYTEDDVPDPVDLYGRTKLLGEVAGPDALTLRTSIIGLELARGHSLVEWFLRQAGVAAGWTRALYSGLTTAELARVILRLLEQEPDLAGVWHVSSDPIAKYDLLVLLRDALGSPVEVRPDAGTVIDRTLDSHRFRARAGYQPPAWSRMIDELAGAVRQRELAVGV